ncbi:hypothetical protein TWF696_002491 [Orbilia brochopaga]|uniref:FAD-binding PCMH-type domain-containing protein n=1 Tax=Orbilia brochopaga TaxID=3140254 RepID=A0AAV9U2B0_9PEZI
MATIAGLACEQYAIGTAEYEKRYEQFATSSFKSENRMRPALIVFPKTKEDISKVVKHAKRHKIAVAIRTGGHQYSGASSTFAPNIQLDLRTTFQGSDDRHIFEKNGKIFVRTSVSWSLGEFHDFLARYNLFITHGVCIDVGLGGHIQTGGYGLLLRSFGLFGDHIVSLEIIDHNGDVVEVTPTSDKDLFGAILGGSPGNFGVITHFTVQVYRDADYQGARCLKALYWYDEKILKRLLDIGAEMADSADMGINYDYNVLVVSENSQFLSHIPELDARMRKEFPQYYGEDGRPNSPRAIIVYAQWVPLSKDDKCNESWFESIREGCVFDLPTMTRTLSALTGDWMLPVSREFELPFIKGIQTSDSVSLVADDWARWASDRLDAIVKPDNGCHLSSHFMFGGRNSKFKSNASNGTSYSWRDTTVLWTMDIYYTPGHKQDAVEWRTRTLQEGIGPNGKFCKKDRRFLWGSQDGFDLDADWRHYYEDETKYNQLKSVRTRADPDGTFTPNTFSVARNHTCAKTDLSRL